MHLVEIFLPLRDPGNKPFPSRAFAEVREVLTARFGGLTAFSRTPAVGYWDDDKRVEKDDIIVLEVMVEAIDDGWWSSYRRQLEEQFRQEQIVIRVSEIRLL